MDKVIIYFILSSLFQAGLSVPLVNAIPGKENSIQPNHFDRREGLYLASAPDPTSAKSDSSKIIFPVGTDPVGESCRLSKCNMATTNSALSYICGSDGKTYKNLAEFGCVRNSCSKGLEIISEGKCADQSHSGTDEQSTTNTKSKTIVGNEVREKKLFVPTTPSITCNPDSCGCPDDFTPICGTDGVTYGNSCLLECNRKCSPNVVQFHDGYCGRLFFRDGKSGVFQSPMVRPQPIVYTLSGRM